MSKPKFDVVKFAVEFLNGLDGENRTLAFSLSENKCIVVFAVMFPWQKTVALYAATTPHPDISSETGFERCVSRFTRAYLATIRLEFFAILALLDALVLRYLLALPCFPTPGTQRNRSRLSHFIKSERISHEVGGLTHHSDLRPFLPRHHITHIYDILQT